MNQLSLSKKLILGFCILMVLYVGFSVYVHEAVADQNFATKDAESWMRTSTVVTKLDNHMTDTKNMILLSARAKEGSPELKELQDSVAAEKGEVESAFAEYKALLDKAPYETEEERQDDLNILNNEVKLWNEYIAAVKPAEALINEGKGKEAWELMKGDAEAKFQAAMDAVAEDIKTCEEGTTEAVAKADSIYETVTVVLTVVTVAAVVFIVLVNVILSRSITSSANELVRVTDLVTQGDLRSRVALDGNDEFCRIGDGLNHMIDSVRHMCGQIQNTSQQVAAASEELTASAQQSAEATNAVAQAVTNVAESSSMQTQRMGVAGDKVEDLVVGMRQVTEALDSSIESVQNAVRQANDGNTMAGEIIKEMNDVTDTVLDSAERVAKLGERSKEIDQIVEVISSIAGQTNLLALNAAIEAARAGEYGRGFAVVAEEIRKLAEESQNAAQQISDLVQGIQKDTDDAVRAMNNGASAAEHGKTSLAATGEAFNSILVMVQRVKRASDGIYDTVNGLQGPINEIVKVTDDVSKAADNVTEESQNVSAATEQQAAGIQEIADASRTLAGHAQDLQDTAMQFKL